MARALLAGNLILIACGAVALRLPVAPPAALPLDRVRLVAEPGPGAAPAPGDPRDGGPSMPPAPGRGRLHP